jgi:hypothetical protein
MINFKISFLSNSLEGEEFETKRQMAYAALMDEVRNEQVETLVINQSGEVTKGYNSKVESYELASNELIIPLDDDFYKAILNHGK